MFGGRHEPHLRLFRIPELTWGGELLRDIGVAALSKDVLNWYSQKTPTPVAGFIGGNVLVAFRVEIHYRDKQVFLLQEQPIGPHEMDMVGIILCPDADGSFRIIGAAKSKEHRTSPKVLVDDKLLAVDGKSVRAHTLGQVVDLLRGQPGSVHLLLVERRGKNVAIRTEVIRFW